MAVSKESSAAKGEEPVEGGSDKKTGWLSRQLARRHAKLLVFAAAFAVIGAATLLFTYAATSNPAGPIKWAQGLCLDDKGGKLVDRNPIEVWNCNSTGAQQWRMPGDGTIHLGTSKYCLDVKYSGTTPKTTVWLWHCNGTGAQQWAQSGETLVNPESHLCLDNSYSKAQQGNPVWVYTCNGTVAQKWTVPKAPTTPPPAPAPAPSPTPPPSSSLNKPYYVDCTGGSDSNSGLSTSAAWRTLGKASRASVAPGSGILLKRGCVFDNQSLDLRSSGKSGSYVTVSSYGSGDLPVIKRHSDGADINVTASYTIIDGVAFDAVAPHKIASSSKKCAGQAVGNVQGVTYASGAAHNIMRNSTAVHLYAGVYIDTGASWNHIVNNDLSGNNMMSPDDATANNDAGAFGVLLWGDNNEVAHNQLSSNRACSFDYGTDGSGIEVYGGRNNAIHHNYGRNDDGFTELGSKRSTGNTYAYNIYTASIGSSFLVTRGPGDKGDGPVYNTTIYNNTVYLPVSGSGGVVCYAGCSPSIFTMRNNIIWVNGQDLSVEGSFNESNNIYWRTGGNPDVEAKISSSSKKVDPKFVNPGAGDFHLKSGSPAINAGSSASVGAGYTTDYDGVKVPTGSAPDVGAFEFH